MSSKITYDEAMHKFSEIMSYEEFCALSTEAYSLAYSLKERNDLADQEKLDVTKKALVNLGAIADRNGKLLLETAKRYKNLIDQIEKSA